MVVRRLYSGNVIVNHYVVPDDYVIIDYNIARIKTPDDHWYISTFYIRDYVIIDYNIARIKTPDDHWYISTYYSQDYVIIDYNIARIKTDIYQWSSGVFILAML
jgi:hypothetical protein